MDIVKIEVKIVNRLGLHARAAASFVKLASRFQSEITVRKGKIQINGKSIMGLLMLTAGRGSVLELEANGVDAKAALKKLRDLIKKKFDEGE